MAVQVARRDDAKKPHAYMQGLTLPANFSLPDLEKVREDAAQIREEMCIPRELTAVVMTPEGQSMVVHRGLAYAINYSSLFRFAMYCATREVPDDILPQCIWACEWYIRASASSTLEQMHFTKAMKPNQNEDMQFVLLQKIRYKASEYLLLPQIDQPVEALRHLQAVMKGNEEKIGIKDHWAEDCQLMINYCVALARSRTDDVEAKALLSKAIDPGTLLNVKQIATCKVYLARTLRRLGEVKAAKEMESWLVTWFKKNPHRIDDDALVPMFTTDSDPKTDPVLLGLGGRTWLEGRQHTSKTEQRLGRLCRNCGKVEPEVKLMQCARCKHIFYCSRECQKANHPYHKESCKDMARSLERVATLKASGAKSDARRFAQWKDFRTMLAHPGNGILLAHALNLWRDPSRSRTHIVVKIVEHQPDAKDAYDHFRFTHAGVFKLDDIWPEIEAALCINKGEGKQYIKEMLEEFDHGPCGEANKLGGEHQRYPILDLAFSANPKHVDSYLSYGAVSRAILDRMPYDPGWRKKMNRSGDSPAPLVFLRKGITDAEYIF
ncbi:hypothetical protein BD626DRAFT_115682 [Schizophyllum amplum]|uniref:MYND-type domain-containing protein n=1 Tax=Schizophyllum amplum TaxID=97359 RepID=A0A550CUD6_9AGAR|nr:hypothetical protein BD626DRAFT_115682 [Auriculariopsis ampla]